MEYKEIEYQKKMKQLRITQKLEFLKFPLYDYSKLNFFLKIITAVQNEIQAQKKETNICEYTKRVF